VVVLQGVKEGEVVVTVANFLIDAESNLKAAISGFGQSATASRASAGAGHQAQGTVDDVDAKALTVTLSHGPVASLKWPAMTMEFKLANEALLANVKRGARVNVEFVERQAGEWVITAVKPTATPSRTGH